MSVTVMNLTARCLITASVSAQTAQLPQWRLDMCKTALAAPVAPASHGADVLRPGIAMVSAGL